MEHSKQYDYLRSHNATKVSELNVQDLIEFVNLFMDKGSYNCLTRLQRETLGITPDWTEISRWVEKAYESGKQFRYGLIMGEDVITEETVRTMESTGDRLEYYLF